MHWCTAAARLRRRGEVDCFRFHSLALRCAVLCPTPSRKSPPNAAVAAAAVFPSKETKSNGCRRGLRICLTEISRPSNTNHNPNNALELQQPHSSNKSSRTPSLSSKSRTLHIPATHQTFGRARDLRPANSHRPLAQSPPVHMQGHRSSEHGKRSHCATAAVPRPATKMRYMISARALKIGKSDVSTDLIMPLCSHRDFEKILPAKHLVPLLDFSTAGLGCLHARTHTAMQRQIGDVKREVLRNIRMTAFHAAQNAILVSG